MPTTICSGPMSRARSLQTSTSCACTHTSLRTRSTTRPTKPACCCGRTSRCTADSRAGCAAKPPGKPAPWSTVWATTRACSCGARTTRRSAPIRPARLLATATAPTWGKEVLDRSVARSIARADGTRPVIRHTGSGDHANASFGWLHGELGGLGPALRVVPAARRVLVSIRRPVGSSDRAMDGSRAVAGSRLGGARNASRHAARRVRETRTAERREVVRRMARRDAGVPRRARAVASRRSPALQGHSKRRIRDVRVRRSPTAGRLRRSRS